MTTKNGTNSQINQVQLSKHYNARSLLPKMDKLRALVDMQQPHIVSIVKRQIWTMKYFVTLLCHFLEICG